MVKVERIEGLKVFFSDGDVKKKDGNNIWLYQIHLLSPWEARRWVKAEEGRLELVFD